MKNLTSFVFLIFLGFACQNPTAQRPEWVNSVQEWKKGDGPLTFLVEEGDWEVIIQTVSHPIIPPVVKKGNELLVAFPEDQLWPSGPGFLTLRQGKQDFVFPLELINAERSGELIDLRSPKTVNTDSSLVHQQLLYRVAPNRDLLQVENGQLFIENYLGVNPQTGTFSGESESSLSSYYVVAGTPVELPLAFNYDSFDQKFDLLVGPLKDAYGNLVSDGTLVTFVLIQNRKTWLIEEVTRAGFSRLEVAADKFQGSTVQARLAHVNSPTLSLTIQ